MSAENNSEFAFLDVLLVNAEKYNQVFIQKIKPAWINQTLSRFARSPLHFNKFFEILVDMVVSEHHPEWSNRAIQWLIKIFDNSETAEMAKQCSSSMSRFVSYSAEVIGVEKIVDSALNSLRYAPGPSKSKPKNSELIIVDTNYVFIDDPELNFGALVKRSRKEKSVVEGKEHGDGEFDEMSAISDDDGASISEDDISSTISEDGGVFDVDRNSVSSFTGSQNSSNFPQPRTARVDHVDVCDSGSSDFENDDAQIGTDNAVSEDEEDDEDDNAANFNQSPPSSSSSSEDEREDRSKEGKDTNETQDNEEDCISGEESGPVLRRSTRIRKSH